LGWKISTLNVILEVYHYYDQILMATSENELQKMAYHLNLIARKYNMTIKKQNQWQCGGTKYRE
jgi:hypothetical protein